MLSSAICPHRALAPGVLSCCTITAAASFLAQHYGAHAMLFALLAPVVLGLSLYFRSQGGAKAKSLSLPLFVVGFCFCVALNGAGVVPAAVLEGLDALSRWCLLAAIVGLGIKTSLKSLLTIGYQPLVMVLYETLFLALWILVGVNHLL